MTLSALLSLLAILAIVVAAVWCACLIYEARASRWKKVHVGDRWYWVPPAHNGRELHISDEYLVCLKVRASSNKEHPHRYES